MYESFFGLTEAPFSISPDPRYLYTSQQHQEAMAHLRYGIQETGGFVQLTGEVGTGKTTVCRCMLEQLPDNVDVALILNPQISHGELLGTLCSEIGVGYPPDASAKQLLDLLYERLIETFSQGRRTVLVIDEAQMLTWEVLEQIRILTNLETTKQKLLQIILIGQPELNATLSRPDLRQLAQRITARYHLQPLIQSETTEYIKYRLAVASCHRSVFTRNSMRRVHMLSRGVPRLINVICDRAMLGAYTRNKDVVTAPVVTQAGREVLGDESRRRYWRVWWVISGLAAASLLVAFVLRTQWFMIYISPFQSVQFQSSGQHKNPALQAKALTSQGIPMETANVESSKHDVIRRPSVSEFLNNQVVAREEQEALSQLLQAWRIYAGHASQPTCASIEKHYGLRCLQERGTWEDLRILNRVAALALQFQGETVYILLTGMDSDTVRFSNGTGTYRFRTSEIKPYWRGDYLLLWQAPPNGTEVIAEDSEGVDVLWLRQTLNRVLSLEPENIDNASFDVPLKERIMAFQKSNELQVDDKAGVRTLIRLNSIVDPDVPKLQFMSAG